MKATSNSIQRSLFGHYSDWVLCHHASGNIAIVQNNYLILTNGGVLRATSGQDFTYQQTGGATVVGPGSTLDWGGGQFNVDAGGTVTGSSLGGGGIGISQSGGSVSIDGTVAKGGFDSGGSDVAYSQTGGTLGGSGTIDGNLIADAGVIFPGDSPGTLTITSNFVSAAFVAMSSPLGLSVTNGNVGPVAVVNGKVPTTILGLLLLTNGTAVLSFGTVTNRPYVVETTVDVAAPSWRVYTNLIGSGGKVPLAVPYTSTPERFFRMVQP
jgi:hypothetical protein